jgi:hypothetical protein
MVVKRSARPADAEAPSAIPIEEGSLPKPKAVKKRVKKDRSKYRRLSIDMPLELHFRLGAHATMRRKDSMALACEMIERGCANLTKDDELKAAFADMSRQSSDAA